MDISEIINNLNEDDDILLWESVLNVLIKDTLFLAHSFWEPGTPDNPKRKLIRFYGFRKINGSWSCIANKDI
jgi:hypothetical protein